MLRVILLLSLLLQIGALRSAHAGGTGVFDPSAFGNPYSILSGDLVNALVKTIGLTTDHRAYEPATAMGPRGFDLSLEATLAQIPGAFNQALSAAGSSSVAIPFIPVPRINLHKGMGERVDGGASIIYFLNSHIIGFDLKIVLDQPEEGPTWALRFNYTTTKLEIPGTVTVDVSTSTFKPEILVSRQLDFADPYIGAGYSYAMGDVSITPPAPLPSGSASGRGGSFYAFTGVGMKLIPLGLKLTLEGAYNVAGANALGMKFGFNF